MNQGKRTFVTASLVLALTSPQVLAGVCGEVIRFVGTYVADRNAKGEINVHVLGSNGNQGWVLARAPRSKKTSWFKGKLDETYADFLIRDDRSDTVFRYISPSKHGHLWLRTSPSPVHEHYSEEVIRIDLGPKDVIIEVTQDQPVRPVFVPKGSSDEYYSTLSMVESRGTMQMEIIYENGSQGDKRERRAFLTIEGRKRSLMWPFSKRRILRRRWYEGEFVSQSDGSKMLQFEPGQNPRFSKAESDLLELLIKRIDS